MVLLIVGKSNSGKTTIEKALHEKGIHRIISYTDRPKRINEEDNLDYHFISTEDFTKKLKENFFAEHSFYNGHYYGISIDDLNNGSENAIAVVDTSGMKMLKRIKGLEIKSVCIECPDRQRIVRAMNRGDDILETFRRFIHDQGMFVGIEYDVDKMVKNEDGKLQEAVEEIYNILE